MSWRDRFGMHAAPLPRGAAGDSFFDGDPHYQRLARAFAWLAAEPGIGVVTGEPGVGKSSAMRHLCRALSPSQHRVVYLCDCAVKPLDLYRMLAAELGLRPGPRAHIVADIKRALVSLVDDRGVVPIVILDDAQGLRDDLLHELHGLTSIDFDGRDYLTLWLVGHPLLARRLRLQQHAALAQRVMLYAPLVAKTDPALVSAMLDHGLAAAGAPPDLITPDARAMLIRVSRGIPRLVSHLLRIALVLADDRAQPSIDASLVNSAVVLLTSNLPILPSCPRPNPASTVTRDHANSPTRHSGLDRGGGAGGPGHRAREWDPDRGWCRGRRRQRSAAGPRRLAERPCPGHRRAVGAQGVPAARRVCADRHGDGATDASGP